MEVLIEKTESIKRCLARVREEFANDAKNLQNYTKQDSIVLNLQRACEQSIDIANYLVAKFQLGTPKHSREAFSLIADRGIISCEIKENMQKMIGFRNLAVHNYKKLELAVLENILSNKVADFDHFIAQIFSYLNK